MKRCNACGAIQEQNAKFCMNCGSSFAVKKEGLSILSLLGFLFGTVPVIISILFFILGVKTSEMIYYLAFVGFWFFSVIGLTLSIFGFAKAGAAHQKGRFLAGITIAVVSLYCFAIVIGYTVFLIKIIADALRYPHSWA